MKSKVNLVCLIAFLSLVVDQHLFADALLKENCSVFQRNSTHLVMSCDQDLRETSSDNSAICGNCDHLVSWSERGVACETCGRWFHAACQSINTKSYEDLGKSDVLWHCEICNNDNYSYTMFDLHGIGNTTSHTSQDCNSSIDSDFRPFHSSTPSQQGRQNKFQSRPLRIINVNFQSIVSKKAETLELLDRLKPDVIIGTETWLTSDIKDSELLTHHYKIYRKDRKKGRGGGVLIGIKDDLQSTKLDSFDSDCENIWVKVLTRTLKSVYICAFYRPDVSDTKALTTFENTLKKVAQLKNVQMIIGGDFNLPSWNWSEMKFKDKGSYRKSHEDFVDVLNDCDLQQVVLEPTRASNILDVIFTNAPDLVPRVEVIPGLSDHCIVFLEYNVKVDRKKNALRQIYLYRRADWEKIKDEMSQLEKDIENMIASGIENIDEVWEKFKNTLLESMEKHIPKKNTRPRDSYPWITHEIKKMIKKRDRQSKKLKKNPRLVELEAKYKETRRGVKKLIRKEYWTYVCSLFEENKDEVDTRPCLKRFWTYIKHQRSSSVGISPLRHEGKLVTEPKEKAEILNKQFFKAFSSGLQYSKEEFLEKCEMDTSDKNYSVMDDIEISENGIAKLLSGLNPAKATGPDKLPPRVLKELSTQLAPILTMIYRLSLNTGQVPADWRHALVSPVFKKGEHYEPINYRPVSLTSIPCKILEHVLVSNLMKHFENNCILNKRQHGFRRGRSCESQLLEFVEEVSAGLDSGLPTDVVIMDFAKAFDRVNHSLLTHKLEQYGVTGTTNKWIGNFLQNRSQAVVVEGETSEPICVKSGVPQGSVLGPCLFLAYINDLPEKVTSTSRLFADDTLLHRLIKEAEDKQSLQKDLESLEKWEAQWDMHFHPQKCNILSVERSKPKVDSQDYFLHGQKLEKVADTKYFGVTLQNNLKFDKHIETICSKANKMLGLLGRNLKSAPSKTKELGYNALVRPVLEYASCVWDPYTTKEKTKIEKNTEKGCSFCHQKLQEKRKCY